MTDYVVTVPSDTGAGAPACQTPAQIVSAGGGGPAFPTGGIIMWSGLLSAIPSGWVLCDGNNGTPNLLAKFVKGVANASTDPGATGGAASQSYTPQGTVAAPTFTGTSSQVTSAVSAGTPAGTVSQPTFTGTSSQSTSSDSAGTPAGTIAWPAGVPAAANESAHTHSVTAAGTNGTSSVATTSGSFKGTNSGGFSAIGGAAPGSSFTVGAQTFTGSAVTSGAGSAHTHTISWPAGVPTFAGSALAGHSHTLTASGTVSQPTFSGSALGTHTHTLTPAGTNSAPAFTGTPATIATEPAYYALAYIMKT